MFAPGKLHLVVHRSKVATLEKLINEIGRENKTRRFSYLNRLVFDGDSDKTLLTFLVPLERSIVLIPQIEQGQTPNTKSFIQLSDIVNGKLLLITVNKTKGVAWDRVGSEIKDAGNKSAGIGEMTEVDPLRGDDLRNIRSDIVVSHSEVLFGYVVIKTNFVELVDKGLKDNGVRAFREMVLGQWGKNFGLPLVIGGERFLLIRTMVDKIGATDYTELSG
jgi:hypothetical protein